MALASLSIDAGEHQCIETNTKKAGKHTAVQISQRGSVFLLHLSKI